MQGYPGTRLRRLRQSRGIRRLVGLSMPGPEHFLWPVFVRAGTGVREPIDAMPGQFRMSPDVLVETLKPVVDSGVGGVLVFGLPLETDKDDRGGAAAIDDGVTQRAVRAIRDAFPGLVVATDVCLCAYTSHGHCGPLDASGNVDNDAALALLGKVACSHADAGATMIAPSAMMDGQVTSIRDAMDADNHANTLIMSYSTKFASSMYGPFRDAGASAPGHGDRRGYQASYTDAGSAYRESVLDEGEGADILMVKPGLFYLDILAGLRQQTDLPLAVYNVSGEYSMLHAMADRGWGELKPMVQESTLALARAGADIIISYWADRYDELLRD